MPKFTVDYDSKHNTQAAYEKLKEFLSKGDEIKKLDSQAQCSFNDQNQTCQLKGSQFKAEVQVTGKGDGSKVSITVDLPLLLTPFKSKVQEGLQKMLSRHLG